jgi:uncharacterized protein (UPF0276 family)
MSSSRPSASHSGSEAAGLPALGVGIVYSSGLEPLLATHPELVDVLEIEPQTTWIETGDDDAPYLVRLDVQDHIAALPGRKLVHSVGTPVGGSVQAHAAQIPLLRETVERLDAPWASEHLSFNLTPDFFTGFFLPPRQTEKGVGTYVDAVERLRGGLGVPLAVETGVNYLRRRPDEIPDGEFIAAVADGAGCGILLDLHNVYCNELNGRQRIDEFLSQVPLDRVWELHVAGGFEFEGFWLDAHSGAIPEPLERIARDIVPTLPNLKAIVFELFASFLPHFGLDAARAELEKLHELWALRRERSTAAPHHARERSRTADTAIEPAAWETALGSVVIGRPPTSPLEQQLAEDPGTRLVEALVKEFRGSMVVAVYRLTSRLLMLALGPDVFRALLEDFWSRTPPHQFAGTEADAFADYLGARNVRLPQLDSILAFERAALQTMRDGKPRVVRFNVDPLPMLRALADGILLENPGEAGEYEIEVTEDGPITVGAGAAVDADAASRTFPFH